MIRLQDGMPESLRRRVGQLRSYAKHAMSVARRSGDPVFRAQGRAVRRGMVLPSRPRERARGVWAVSMVRDEEDIIASVIEHLFAQGVAGVLVADNGSKDHTRVILSDLATRYNVHIADDNEPAYYQDHKMSLLSEWARRAGATWIVPFDADEFWWAPSGTLATWLTTVPAEVVYARIHNVFPSDGETGWAMDAEPHIHPKVAFRAFPAAHLAFGNHDVIRPGRRAVGLLITHVPWRSAPQLFRKLRNGAEALAKITSDTNLGGHWRLNAARSDVELLDVWADLRAGYDSPDLGWSPFGELLPVREPAQADPFRRLPHVVFDPPRPPLTVLYLGAPIAAEYPYAVLARQAAEWLDARLRVAAEASSTVLARLLTPQHGCCLILASRADALDQALADPSVFNGFDRVVAWLLGPGKPTGQLSPLAELFLADPRPGSGGAPLSTHLPVGADVLGRKPRPQRRIDLQRVGPPPPGWDDERLGRLMEGLGQQYRSTLQEHGLAAAQQRTVWAAMGASRFVLASNASPGGVLDLRWADALASGATVLTDTEVDRPIERLLWPGAVVTVAFDDPEAVAVTLRSLRESWTEQTPLTNRRLALRTLDWRLRLATINESLARSAPRFEAELLRVRSALADDA